MDPAYRTHATDAGVAADLADRCTRIEKINGKPFAVRPGELPVLIEDAFGPADHIKQLITVATLLALKEFILYHRQVDASVPPIFADKAAKRFTAVFDYHPSSTEPDFCSNRAAFALAHDPRYAAWAGACNRWISQEDLVDLIENNAPSLIEPASASMLELAENLEIHQSSKVVNRRSRVNGTGQLSFETSEGEASTKLPETLVIGVPIYKGLRTHEGKTKAWQIRLRLRYRVKDGHVSFYLKMENLEDLLDDLWEDLVKSVRAWECATVIEGDAPAVES